MFFYLIINAFLILFMVLFCVPLLLNQYLFKRDMKKKPLVKSRLMKLIDRYPILYEFSILIWNFPSFKHIYSPIPIVEGESILQVGCGTGLLNKSFENYNIENLDINSNYLRYGYKKKRFLRYMSGSVYKLPYGDNSFDTIIFARCFHHIFKQKKALQECNR